MAIIYTDPIKAIRIGNYVGLITFNTLAGKDYDYSHFNAYIISGDENLDGILEGNVHGGVTFCEDGVVGWDYGHYGDKCIYQNYETTDVIAREITIHTVDSVTDDIVEAIHTIQNHSQYI